MSSQLKRILFQAKLPVLIFLITFVSFVIILLANGGSDDALILDVFNLIISCSIIVAILSGLVKYSSLISKSKDEFRMNGVGNRIIKYFEPLIADFIVFIIIDIVILAIYYGYDISGIIEKSNGKFSAIYLSAYSFVLVKYLISSVIFFSFSIVKNWSDLIGVALIQLFSLRFFSELFAFNNLIIFATIFILLITSYIIYYIKYKKHNFKLIDYIFYGYVITLVVLNLFRDLFPTPYLTRDWLNFGISNTYINVFGLVLLLAVIFILIGFKEKRIMSYKIFIGLYLIPLALGSSLFFASSYCKEVNDVKNFEVYTNSNEMKSFVNYEEWSYSYPGGNIVESKESEQLLELQNKIIDKIIYKVKNIDTSLIDSVYLNDKGMLLISVYNNEKQYYINGIIKHEDLNNIFKDQGYQVKTFYEVDFINDTNYIIESGNKSNNIKNYDNISELDLEHKIMINDELYNFLSTLTYSYSDEYIYIDSDHRVKKYEVFEKDGKVSNNVFSDYAYVNEKDISKFLKQIKEEK
ncbi:hypothetical protein OKW22_000192 [Bacilli bacterium PM5-3]|nr:hypothetical protein [Bacilli bacterium PM5-3]MDH6603617.1 hypothetical protein [Bacilli bacterium PM5-9]